MLHVFIRKLLAFRTLRQAHAFAQCAIVGFGVGCVERFHGRAAGYADWHVILRSGRDWLAGWLAGGIMITPWCASSVWRW